MIMLVVLKGNPIQRQLISANLSADSDFQFGFFVARCSFGEDYLELHIHPHLTHKKDRFRACPVTTRVTAFTGSKSLSPRREIMAGLGTFWIYKIAFLSHQSTFSHCVFHTKLPSSCLFIPSCHMLQRRRVLITAVSEAHPCLQSTAEPFQKKKNWFYHYYPFVSSKWSVAHKMTKKLIQFYRMEKRSTEGLCGCIFLWLSKPSWKLLNSNTEQFSVAIFKQWGKHMLDMVQLMPKRKG